MRVWRLGQRDGAALIDHIYEDWSVTVGAFEADALQWADREQARHAMRRINRRARRRVAWLIEGAPSWEPGPYRA